MSRSKGLLLEKAKERAVIFALMIVIAKGFSKVCVLLDAKEVVDALNDWYDWVINALILDIKYLWPIW